MDLELLNTLTKQPKLYEKGTSLMWTDPHISKQLLAFHINPDIDVASRSREKIRNITKWILERVKKPKMEILDLGCGPGLYTELFAQEGHAVTGLDFSENSIHYAKDQAREKQLNIEYFHQNYLEINFEKQDLEPILESAGFSAIKNHENVLPEGDCWNGENVTFYSAKK